MQQVLSLYVWKYFAVLAMAGDFVYTELRQTRIEINGSERKTMINNFKREI